jgi:O-acetyl-ADP-ribose deacetylase (regulator of RNase III)
MNKLFEQFKITPQTMLLILKGDITQERVGAIVNAANAFLQHGGGVAGAVSLRGGPVIQDESDLWIEKYGPISHDSPAYTSAGKLPCQYVIHAVGPVLGEGDEDKKLSLAVAGSMILADRLGVISIAFPAISTGVFGFPTERAAKIIFEEIGNYFSIHSTTGLTEVRLVRFDEKTLATFLKAAQIVFGNAVV